MSAPPEVEATLTRLSSHRGVKGVLILSSESGKVIRFTGSMLEEPATSTAGTTGNGETDRETNGQSVDSAEVSDGPAVAINGTVKKYADAVRRIVESSRMGIEGLDGEDKVKFLRLRTRKYELMITPEDKYTLVVFHDPTPS